MRSKAVWLSIPVLASGCYLSAESEGVKGSSMVSGVGGDLDAGRLMVDAQVDARPFDSSNAAPDTGCTSNQACPASAPVCNAGACSACKQPIDCARFAATPACAANGGCVTCFGEQKSLCTGDAGVCEPTTNQCVQCVDDSACPAEAADCKDDHTCGKCTADSQCSPFKQVCDTSSGLCIDCRPSTEAIDCRSDKTCDPAKAECPGTACDPKLFTCTTKTRGTVSTCQPCVSDTECVSAHKCIATSLVTTSTGDGGMPETGSGHCLKLTSAGCAPPYGIPLSRASLSGAVPQTYCGFSEARTSCEAIRALSNVTSCRDDTACAAPGALCKSVNFIANKCTYHCASNLDCPTDFLCGGSGAASYCGAPTM